MAAMKRGPVWPGRIALSEGPVGRVGCPAQSEAVWAESNGQGIGAGAPWADPNLGRSPGDRKQVERQPHSDPVRG
jgi:hypothetical protein